MRLSITSMLERGWSLIGNYGRSWTRARGTGCKLFSIRGVYTFIRHFSTETDLRRVIRFRRGHTFSLREITVAFGFRFATKATSNTGQHVTATFLAVGVRILSKILAAYTLSMHVTQTFTILRRLLRAKLAVYILNTLSLDSSCS